MGTPMILSSLRVHREQSGRNALIFDPFSPEQLAEIFCNFTPVSPEMRLAFHNVASKNACSRTRIFAENFATLIDLLKKNTSKQ